ncbi:phospholipid-transporting ATPase ABCA3-like [Haematobia irritans]|uniref:phospholipid-transporting ATPase ABCA3-like n=1 Tax=Haematobia irritans TaxID=7368 RepID=UPI003F502B2F
MENKWLLLLKKNIKCEIRSWKWLAIEIIVIFGAIFTIYISGLELAMYGKINVSTMNKTKIRKNIGDITVLAKIGYIRNTPQEPFSLLYAPIHPITTSIINETAKKLDLFGVEGYNSDYEDFDLYFYRKSYLAIIIFDKFSPDILSVTMRFPNQFRTLHKGKDCWERFCYWSTRRYNFIKDTASSDGNSDVDLYIREGYLQVLHSLFMSWINYYDSSKYTDISSLSINTFLHDSQQKKYFHRSLTNFAWFFYNFVYFLPFLNVIWKLSIEWENQIPQHHTPYGLSSKFFWLTHFLTNFLHFMISNVVIFVFLCFDDISNNGRLDYLIIFLLLNSCLLILCAFILSTLVEKRMTAILLASSIWLTNYGIFSYNFQSSDMDSIEIHTLLLLLISFNGVFPYGILYLEDQLKKQEEHKGISFLFQMQCGFIVFYLVCLYYLNKFRMRNAIGQKFYEYRSNSKIKQERSFSDENAISEYYTTFKHLDWSYFEYGPIQGHLLLLENASVYEDKWKKIPLLKNISMRLFPNEISVVLGANGSGKTMLIHMLSGQVKYDGHILYEDTKEISENWPDYCRQFDILPSTINCLYDFLSVEEHITYVLQNKSSHSRDNELQMEIHKWMQQLKRVSIDPGKLIKSLNFFHKRLVALCCTLCGNSKIILMDEPTRHLAIDECRSFWNILRMEKSQRVLLLTTSSIDEANEIADRIAILNKGSLKACGTPFYLKSNLSKGTFLVLLTNSQASTKDITNFLKKYISNIYIYSHFNNRVVYILPQSKRIIFQKLFTDLEREINRLGIIKMYVTENDLNEVYMELTTRPEIRKHLQHINKTLNLLNEPKPEGQISLTSALLYKKLLYQAPNVVPVVIIMFALVLICLIYSMSQHLRSIEAIDFGLSPNKNLFIGRNDCKYFEITSIEEMQRTKFKWIPQKWIIDHIQCGSSPSYDNVINTDVNVYNKIAAIEKLDTSHMTLWINERIFHSPVLALNLAHKVILNDLYPQNPFKRVNVKMQPIWEPVNDSIALNHYSNLYVALTWGIIMPLTVASFIIAPLDEKLNNMETHQLISGVTHLKLWLINFLWDYVAYELIIVLYMILMSAYIMEKFLAIANFVSFILLSFYGLASIQMVYLSIPLLPNNKCQGFLIIYLLEITLGLCLFVIYWDVADIEPNWVYILMLSPTFALMIGMRNIQAENEMRVFCKNRCDKIVGCIQDKNACSLISQCCSKSYFQWTFPGTLPSIAYIVLIYVILTIWQCWIIYRKNKKYAVPQRIKEMSSVCYSYDDELVIAEKLRISNMNMSTCKKYEILVDQLEYEIPKLGNRVKAISFALNRYQCLGIYGWSHSGKSHLIKQLVGEEAFRFGEIYICGNEIKHNMHLAIKNLGYCPQTKGFCEESTPQQMFTLFLMLRHGCCEDTFYDSIRNLSLLFNLRNYMNTRLSELPNYIRRRVNIALALIVHNQVLVFDEPTRGLEANERRLIWDVMRKARDNGNAIIFTSQESLELEQIADFVIAIDSGEMMTIGSPQSIREKYTLGLYLEVKLRLDGTTLEEMENNLLKDIENLQRFITFLHAESELIKRHRNVLKYYLPIVNVLYSYLYGALEKNSQRLNISKYMISQASLMTAMENLQNSRKMRIRYKKTQN